MSPLNAPATAKRSEEAFKCIQERERVTAECTCDMQVKIIGRKMKMEEWNSIIVKRQMEISRLIKKAEKDLKQVKDGTLHVSKRGGSYEYFFYDKNEKSGNHKYIPRDNIKLAKELAQKEYAQKILKEARHDLMLLNRMMKGWQDEDYYGLFLKMPEGKQKLVSPYIHSDDDYAEQWLNEKKKIKKDYNESHNTSFPDPENEIITEQGENVRSKSEKIIADKYFMMHIPYVYEIPLHLNGYGDVRPDFVLLNKRTRKTIYHEHLGLMSQAQYCEKAIKKIETYEKNKIYPGQGLLLTYESDSHPLDIKTLEGLIERFLL